MYLKLSKAQYMPADASYTAVGMKVGLTMQVDYGSTSVASNHRRSNCFLSKVCIGLNNVLFVM